MATTATRIYVVGNKADPQQTRLVRAPNQSQAIRHVVSDSFTAVPATQDDLVKHIGLGVKVEDSAADAPPAQGDLPWGGAQ